MARPKGSTNRVVSLKEYFKKGAAQQLWKEGKAKSEESGFSNTDFDDGKYQVQLIDAFSGVSQNGRVQNAFAFQFLNGDYKGKKIYKYQGVENPTGIAILLQDFGVMGVEVDEPDDIDEANKKLKKSKPTLEIRVKTNGEYKNIGVLRILEELDTEEEDEETEKETSDTDDLETEEAGHEDSDEDEEKDSDRFPLRKKAKKEEPEENEDEDSEDDEDDDDEEKPKKKQDEVELEVGMKVIVKHDGERLSGKIIKLYEDDDEPEIKIKQADGTKITVPASSVVDVQS